MSNLIEARRGQHAVPIESLDAAALPACRKRLTAALDSYKPAFVAEQGNGVASGGGLKAVSGN